MHILVVVVSQVVLCEMSPLKMNDGVGRGYCVVEKAGGFVEQIALFGEKVVVLSSLGGKYSHRP